MTSSKISDSVYNANIPDVMNFSAEFVYNFWERTERVLTPSEDDYKSSSVDKWPRYISLTWDIPVRKEYQYIDPLDSGQAGFGPIDIGTNFDFKTTTETVDQILNTAISEDDDFSPQYISQNFSDVTSISQGALDLKNYALLVNQNITSNNQLQKQTIQKMFDQNLSNTQEFKDYLTKVTEAYDVLSDFPADTLGLNVFDTQSNSKVFLTDDRDFFKNLASSLLINYKIHKLAIPDFIINDEALKSPEVYKQFSKAYDQAKLANPGQTSPKVFAFKKNNAPEVNNYTPSAALVKGYLIYKYRKDVTGLVKDAVFYLNDGQKNSFIDTRVLYGKTYVYTISVVCELDILGKIENDKNASTDDYDKLTINLTSRPSSVSVDCIETAPPSPPADISFLFDYINRKLIIHWDFPVNPQHDIKQFQLLRRKRVEEPFELIAQYGFDDTIIGENDLKYLTGERIDVNNLESMEATLRHLAVSSPQPVYRHIDNDFVIDTEFFETTSYIYSLCSVDAHGLISNYSAQYEIKFDPFKNKLFAKVICDEGSPRAYPNMNLKIDAFKDAINTSGDETKHLKVYFSPEFLSVQSEQGKSFKVVETVDSTEKDNAFYLFQLINLDNKKTQTLKIKIVKPIVIPPLNQSVQSPLSNDEPIEPSQPEDPYEPKDSSVLAQKPIQSKKLMPDISFKLYNAVQGFKIKKKI